MRCDVLATNENSTRLLGETHHRKITVSIIDLDRGFDEEIRGRIAGCDVVLAFTSVAASHSDWIKSELDLATELGKPILAISPFKNSRKSQYVLSVATRHVQPWRVDSVVNAIRDLRRANRPTVKIGDIAPPPERSLKSVKDVLRSAFDRRPNALPNVEPLPTPTDTWFRKYWSTREY